jgi:hypothetical protein
VIKTGQGRGISNFKGISRAVHHSASSIFRVIQVEIGDVSDDEFLSGLVHPFQIEAIIKLSYLFRKL